MEKKEEDEGGLHVLSPHYAGDVFETFPQSFMDR